MKIVDLLKDQIKPELNKLYSEAPSGGEWGWFCREHAFHLYSLSKMLGLSAEIKRGDLFGRSTGKAEECGTIISSFRDYSDHAWCKIGDVVPVDLSANFEYFPDFPWVDIVFGEGQVGKYTVCYALDDKTHDTQKGDTCAGACLLYVERQTLDPSVEELLGNPYLLLRQPPKDGLDVVFGKDIFNKVTLHLYELAMGRAERLTRSSRGPSHVLPVIRKRYDDATNEIVKVIETNRGRSLFDMT